MEVQQQHPQAADEHCFQETTGYLKCTKCSLSIHKRTNEASFQAFLRSRCVDEHYGKPHGGHATHALWQKGKGIKCVNCGIQSHLDAEERLILTKALTKECQSNTQRSPTLLQLFGTQAQSSQATSEAGNQPAPTTPPRQAAADGNMSPPAPKKLRFTGTDTPHAPATVSAPQAVLEPATNSPAAEEGEEEDLAQDVTVDFF